MDTSTIVSRPKGCVPVDWRHGPISQATGDASRDRPEAPRPTGSSGAEPDGARGDVRDALHVREFGRAGGTKHQRGDAAQNGRGSGDQPLGDRGRPALDRQTVTFLAAWRENDESMVLGADAWSTSPDPCYGYWVWGEAVDKFERLDHYGQSLAWGWRGSELRWQRFSQRFMPAVHQTWDGFFAAAKQVIAAVNAGSDPKGSDVLELIVAGWLRGEPDILCMDHNGNQLNPGGGAHFLGPGNYEVGMAWRDEERSVMGLRSVLDAHFEKLVGLRGPARLWRLTSESFDPVEA